jgi:type I restriction enzyme S subunit
MSEMEVKPGYKQTELGAIPEDWGIDSLSNKTSKIGSGITPTGGERVYKKEGKPFIRSQNVGWGSLNLTDVAFIDLSTHESFIGTEIKDADLLLNITGASIGRCSIANEKIVGGNVNQHVCIIRVNQSELNPRYVLFVTLSRIGQAQIDSFQAGGNRQGLNFEQIGRIIVPIPPLPEQTAIATALSDMDALISGLDRLIEKKRAIKQAAMQELLTGKRRLPGFIGEWNNETLEKLIICLDNLRVPINEVQRANMQGIYPYCGANGVLDYVNDYLIDDDVILIAEDGGYFDEYATRPIAYKMKGKIWVNNHAHILKAKDKLCQDFIFYSLVHKNILDYLSGGTRAKLNKSELFKIQIIIPNDPKEQTAIATVLSDMDAEISALENRRAKTLSLKQGMMQELLTGRIRLV